jgi:hypothetical protein
LKSLTVFCGSNTGNHPDYIAKAEELGRLLVEKNIKLVYGGGKVGLMGKIADAVLEAGGEVVGIIPNFLARKEVAHDELTQMIRVGSMHERKMKMNELCDGFIAMPGGFGTLEELFEVITWSQLGLHGKPVGILNVAGFYDHLFGLLDHMVEAKLLKPVNRDLVLTASHPPELLDKMEQFKHRIVPKWMDNWQT